ncbi:MAG: hypothetical protein ACTFAK_13945 [Candidatus Electronema sp. VV]
MIDRQAVVPRQHIADDFTLQGAEAVVAEGAFEDGFRVWHGFLQFESQARSFEQAALACFWAAMREEKRAKGWWAEFFDF